MHAVLDQPVINLIDVRKVINGSAVLVFIVNADFVIQDRVKTNVLEAGDLLHVLQVSAIAFAQA
jgi:hypothetical protein